MTTADVCSVAMAAWTPGPTPGRIQRLCTRIAADIERAVAARQEQAGGDREPPASAADECARTRSRFALSIELRSHGEPGRYRADARPAAPVAGLVASVRYSSSVTGWSRPVTRPASAMMALSSA